MATLLLIDGNSLTYRAFFALPTDLATASGQVTNAVFGFTSMLVNLLRDHRPDHVAVAFDRPEPTFRHERVATYKANRDAAPDLLRQQMGLVRQVVETMAIPIVELAGFEADDVIATLAEQAAAGGDHVIIVTGDRDSYQLVRDPSVQVLYNKRGVSDYALYDEAGIQERTGVRPVDYVTYAALRGDPSDNLPGVPGVGEKTAAKLVNTYGDLDGIFAHLDELTPKLRENLAANEEQVRTNAEVMVLVRDVPVAVAPEALVLGDLDTDEVRQLFDFLEFRTLYDRLVEALDGRLEAAEPVGGILDVDVELLSDPERAADALAEIGAGDAPLAVAAAWSGAAGRSPLRALAVAAPVADAWRAVALDDAALGAVATVPPADAVAQPATEVGAALAAVLSRPAGVVGHGVKELLRSLLPHGIDCTTLSMDTEVAAYLIDPAGAGYAVGDLLERHTGMRLPVADAAPEGQLALGDAGEDVPIGVEVGRAAAAAGAAAEALGAVLDARGLRRLHDDVEVPLVRVLARMEVAGVGVDRSALEALHAQLATECAELAHLIQEDAGHEFNVNSTPQLRTVLFDELGLTPQKKTKTGYSTDAASLERLLGQHPIIEHLLRYREVEKLRSTYGEGLLAEVAADDRIHATFNQTVARTGRLSSDAPNLHNIPVRTEEGRAFRRCFVAPPGRTLLVADYNQIELRCIAHLAEDPGLIDAFTSGADIHNRTAAAVFGVDPGAVTVEQRSKAKMVSYGLAYGMEAYGLGQRLGIDTGEAQQILDAYFEAFPNVAAYMDAVVAEAREKGYTETLFGRRRQIPELASSNFRIRQAGERQAKNAGIQGLAADIFKVALVRLDAALEADGVASRLILQVHDEVVVEALDEELDAVTDITVATMAGAFDLRVPLEVNLAHGPTWADAKG